MSTEGLATSFATARGVLENVTVDQLDQSTPCASWAVRQVVNHVVGGAQWFADCTNSGSGAPPDDTDFASGDFLAAYDAGTANALEAADAEGALERTVALPFGTMPGEAFMGLVTIDQFTHAWDLARATGQSTDLNPPLADQLLGAARAAIRPEFRGPDGAAPFGPEQTAPDGASAADRLAAFLGRHVE